MFAMALPKAVNKTADAASPIEIGRAAIAAAWVIVQVPRPSLCNKRLDPLRRPRPRPDPRQTGVRAGAVDCHDRRKRFTVDHVHVRNLARLVLLVILHDA